MLSLEWGERFSDRGPETSLGAGRSLAHNLYNLGRLFLNQVGLPSEYAAALL